MAKDMKISIPMPLIISIEDVGWWHGKDGSRFNQPYRTGMERDHVPEDYAALAALGQGLDMKIISGFVLCEWDKENILRKVPSSTWMGDRWIVSQKNQDRKEKAAWIIKKQKKYIEFGIHGVGHEFWSGGRMHRTEFHDHACCMRNKGEIRKHLDYFFKLMDQYKFEFKPRTFIPPALKHSFGNNGFQKILEEFGIKYVTMVFGKARLFSRPQNDNIAWENNILLVERCESDVKWNHVAASPQFGFNRPVMALHWANILHADPKKNLVVVNKWIQYIKENGRKKGILVSRDTKSCFTQYLHKTLSKIENINGETAVDVSWMHKIPGNLVGKSIFLKIKLPPGTSLKIYGASIQNSRPPFETGFLKLDILNRKNKIFIKPEPGDS
ncbi:MAG: hypothetical protein GXP56_09960 [Deltaproteobacteria bacterium]|nr:hypothetical protein [Deltaproteobacteria bacterium]